MKRFGLVLVLAAIAFFVWGDPAGSLQRIGMWSCQWLHVAKGC
jgi:hypothetical protein